MNAHQPTLAKYAVLLLNGVGTAWSPVAQRNGVTFQFAGFAAKLSK